MQPGGRWAAAAWQIPEPAALDRAQSVHVARHVRRKWRAMSWEPISFRRRCPNTRSPGFPFPPPGPRPQQEPRLPSRPGLRLVPGEKGPRDLPQYRAWRYACAASPIFDEKNVPARRVGGRMNQWSQPLASSSHQGAAQCQLPAVCFEFSNWWRPPSCWSWSLSSSSTAAELAGQSW